MSDMKCPICGKDLVEIELGECWFLVCCNSKCRCKGVASDTVWKHIERTRKALDVAVDALKQIKDGKIPVSLGIYMDINDALEQITALEQKDIK